jgi:glutamine amidotransferase
MITIIDLGLGNVGSIKNMIHRLGKYSLITNSSEEINKATKLILPGIGTFDNAISKLNKLGLQGVLEDKVLHHNVPILCICLGMQLLAKGSEEGNMAGLGWVDGYVKKFKLDNGLKVPHMGWNDVKVKKDSKLFSKTTSDDQRFYFVHSYHFVCDKESDVLCTAQYGHEITAAIERKNIYATQFHPEKSHKYGLDLLNSFISL